MNARNVTTALLIALASFSAAASAEQGSPPVGGERRHNPEMFQKMKSKMIEDQQQRVQILQQGESCIQAASAPDQLRACHKQEHEAMEQLHKQNEQKRDAMREHMKGRDNR
jgi:hypothetical protein